MTEQQIMNQISRCFARLRNQANLSLASLAKKIGVDQTKLSRMEKGEIYSPVDCNKYLDALLDPKDAAEFKSFLESNWEFIDVPDFWNPQRAYLLKAEKIICNITNFLNKYKSSPSQNHLTKGKEQLLSLSKFLYSQDHNIAFLGSIGVGKSTAISYIFNLLISDSKQANDAKETILETGGGGTTICEVKIVDADEYGISITPYSDDEFKSVISDFCKIQWNKYDKIASQSKKDDISQSIELARAIRNMSKLTKKRVDNDKNKICIEQLVLDSNSEDEFKRNILKRVNIQNRTTTSILFDKDPSKNPTQWIAEKFKEINNGRIDNMPMPKTITLMIPNFNNNFNTGYNQLYNITTIDTKGIDDIIVRSDLDDQIRNERTIIIFCVRFNDASGEPTKKILDHIKNDIGISVGNGKFALLILPQDGEALQVKDDEGKKAKNTQEGYKIKKEQIQDTISDTIPIYFYNVHEDDPKEIVFQIRKQLNKLRKSYAKKIKKLSKSMSSAMDKSEDNPYQQALSQINKSISFFLNGNEKLGNRKMNIYTKVKLVLDNAHASTLWACTRTHRRGTYCNLDICHIISNSVRSEANERFTEWLSSFKGQINALKADNSLLGAAKYINDIERFTSESSELKNKFLDAVSKNGADVFCEKIRSSDTMWSNCSSEWGRGPGFKERVLTHIVNWFKENNQLQKELDKLIDKSWNELVISSIRKMISKPIAEH